MTCPKTSTTTPPNEVLSPANLLHIIGRFIHLEIETEEEWDGRKIKKENLIFPRYHQWDWVRDLVQSSRDEGLGHRYLVPHSAGSGKSNSIAWTAHQLSSLYNKSGDKVFHSVVVVTDRTLLDDQSNLSYYAFTATPKPKTLELFGRLPNPDQPPSKQNKPKAFHVYSMRQAIEEGYITIDYPKSSSRT